MNETRDDEQHHAEALAQALEELERDGGGRPSAAEGSELGELLSLAGRVRASGGLERPLDPERRQAIVDGAIETMRRRRSRTAVWLAAAIAASFALVALGVLLVVDRDQPLRPDSAFAAPTDGLFSGPFREDQSPAERMDRIVEARTRGYFDALIMERREGLQAEATLAAAGEASRGGGERQTALGRVLP